MIHELSLQKLSAGLKTGAIVCLILFFCSTARAENPFIESSSPASGEVDSRQDRSISSPTRTGITTVEINFSEAMTDLSGSALSMANFQVRYYHPNLSNPESVDTPIASPDILFHQKPAVTLALRPDRGPGSVDVNFTPSIALGDFTVITAINMKGATATLDSEDPRNRIVLGFQPLDFTGNGQFQPSTDISAFNACYNNTNQQPLTARLRRCDLNRDGSINTTDVIRFNQLRGGLYTNGSWPTYDIRPKPSLVPPQYVGADRETLTINTQDNSTIYLGGFFKNLGTANEDAFIIDASSSNSGNILQEYSFFGGTATDGWAIPDGEGGFYFSHSTEHVMHILSSGAIDPNFQLRFDARTYALAKSGDWLFIAGGFTNVWNGNTRFPRNGLVKVNRLTGQVDSWTPASPPPLLPSALIVANGYLYVGGVLSSVKKFDAQTGQSIPWSGVTIANLVLDLESSGPWIYVAGSGERRLARLSVASGEIDSNWNPNPNADVGGIHVSGSSVYVIGSFSQIGGQARSEIAELNDTNGSATNWNPGGQGFSRYPIAFIHRDGDWVYVAGAGSSVGGWGRNGLARISATTTDISLWNPGPGGPVRSFALSGSRVFISVDSGLANKTPRSTLASITRSSGAPTSWNPVITRDGMHIHDIEIAGTSVFVGGYFSTINGQARSGLAEFNKTTGELTTWNPNLDKSVDAVSVTTDKIYVVGDFTQASGQARNYVASFDQTSRQLTSWNPTLNQPALSLLVDGDAVYVGGKFTTVNGETRNHIAKFSASTGQLAAWNPNIDGDVWAIAKNGNTVLIGGAFDMAGGQSRAHFIEVDASTGALTSWNPNFSGPVFSLVVDDQDPLNKTLYVGGSFTAVGQSSRNFLAAFGLANKNLLALNPSPDYHVKSIALSPSGLFIGGGFRKVSGLYRQYFAQVLLP